MPSGRVKWRVPSGLRVTEKPRSWTAWWWWLQSSVRLLILGTRYRRGVRRPGARPVRLGHRPARPGRNDRGRANDGDRELSTSSSGVPATTTASPPLLGDVFALAEGDSRARQRWAALTDLKWPKAPRWDDALTAARRLGLPVHHDWVLVRRSRAARAAPREAGPVRAPPCRPRRHGVPPCRPSCTPELRGSRHRRPWPGRHPRWLGTTWPCPGRGQAAWRWARGGRSARSGHARRMPFGGAKMARSGHCRSNRPVVPFPDRRNRPSAQ